MNNLIIFDLDNCISNDEWRLKTINWSSTNGIRRYHHYHMLCGFDELGNEELLQVATDRQADIAILTARPLYVEIITIEWLKRNNISWNYLFMRRNDDTRPAFEVKFSQLTKLLKLGKNIKIIEAHDDKLEVIDMYRLHGISAEVSQLHDGSGYKRPI